MLTKVDGMPLQPHTCTLCGQGPTDNDGHTREVIFAEGVDIDWGNAVYICWECAELIADLVGRTTREGFDKIDVALKELTEEHSDLLDLYEAQEKLLDKIREGTNAQKQIRATAKAAA